MSGNITTVVYEAIDDTPPNRRFLAQVYSVGKTKPTDGSEPKEVLNFLPVHFTAETEAAVTAAAEAWWTEEQTKETRRKEAYAAANNKRQARRAAAPTDEQTGGEP
jgi:hypothetical protein